MFPYDRNCRRAAGAAALLLATILTLAAASGCTLPGSGGGNDAGAADGAEAAVFPVYVTENPLTFEHIGDPEYDDAVDDRMRWIRATGLASEAAIQKINDRLYEKYMEIKHSDLPPYRGLRARIPEGAKLESEWIISSAFGSVNNILSIEYTHGRIYSFPAEDGDAPPDQTDGTPLLTGESVIEYHPLNFNLLTGEEITLADLFGEDEDAFKAIDAAALSFLRNSSEDYYTREDFGGMLIRDYRSFTLIEPYAPVDAAQKFLISDNTLGLVLDHETPQYAIDRLSSEILAIPLTELGAAGAAAIERFALPEADMAALYTSDAPPLRRLLQHQSFKPFSRLPDDLGSGLGQRDVEGVQLYGSITGSCETTPEFEQLLTDMLSFNDEDREDLQFLQSLRGADAQGGGEAMDANIHISFARYGNIYTTDRILGASVDVVWDEDVHARILDAGVLDLDWIESEPEYIRYHREDYRSFDAASLEPLGPAEIFAEGFDYESLLKDALDKTISDTYAHRDDETPPSPEERERLFAELLTNGVYIDSVGMMFSAPPASKISGERGFYPWIYYADVGCENLRLFD
jgi:hypothetical protein